MLKFAASIESCSQIILIAILLAPFSGVTADQQFDPSANSRQILRRRVHRKQADLPAERKVFDKKGDYSGRRKYGSDCCSSTCSVSRRIAFCVEKGCTCVPQDLPTDIATFALDSNLLTSLDDYEFRRYADLVHLNISKNRIKNISANTFFGLSNVQILMLNENPIEEFVDNVFSPMPLLKLLDLSVSNLCRFNPKAFINLTLLQTLFMKASALREIPNFRTSPAAPLPSLKLEYLHLANNLISSISPQDFSIYPSLKVINLQSNKLKKIFPYTFRALKNLKILELAHNMDLTYKEHSFDNPNLRIIYLFETKFQFKKNQNFFGQLPLLERLTLDSTKVRNSGLNDIVPNPLAKLSNLKYLSMKSLMLKNEWVEIYLQNLTALKFLDITNNYVSQFDKKMFESLPQNIEEILFPANKITMVLRYHVPDWIWYPKNNSNLLFDFHSNPFNCDCNILWLKRWLNTKKNSSILGKTSQYTCFTPPNLYGQRISDLKTISVVSCFSALSATNAHIYASVAACFAAHVVVAVAALVHRYRWHARYFIFVYRNKWRQQQQQRQLNEGSYEYDAFISYCASDRHWVVEHIGKFENEAQLKFCFHDRDWTVGRYIMENILDSMRASRKLIFIVSNAFCRSAWCQDELQLAHTQLVETSLDGVIMVLIEPLDDQCITETMPFYLNRTYIEWPADDVPGREHGVEIFWRSLRKGIGDAALIRDLETAGQAYDIQIQQQQF